MQSLRRPSTLQLQDSGDFETEEFFFRKWELEKEARPVGLFKDEQYLNPTMYLSEVQERSSTESDAVHSEYSPVSVSASTSPSSMSTMKVSDYSSSSSSDLTVLSPSFSRQRSVSIAEAGFRDSLGTLNTRRRSDGSFSLASSRLSRFSYLGGLDKRVIFNKLNYLFTNCMSGFWKSCHEHRAGGRKETLIHQEKPCLNFIKSP